MADLAEGAQDGFVVCFDGDEAGQRGAHHLLEDLRDRGIRRVRNLVPPDGLDATEWLLSEARVTAPARQTGADFGLAIQTGPSRPALGFGIT